MSIDSWDVRTDTPSVPWMGDGLDGDGGLEVEIEVDFEGFATAPSDPLLGRVLADRYRLIERIGRGGMGVVYRAEHVVLGKHMAIKILSGPAARDPHLVSRFLQEARAAAAIDHDGVVDVIDCDTTQDGLAYIAMELLDGEDLAEMMRRCGPLSFARVRDLVLQLCDALGAAHDRGVVHRDLKPDNIFLVRRGARHEVVKLIDFGVAKVAASAGGAMNLTRVGIVLGTPGYLSPEQACGGVADGRGDVYALGCLMYEMLTGEQPFRAESVMAVLAMQISMTPEPPTARAPAARIPRELEEVVLRAMAKLPAERYQSMAELAQALNAVSFMAAESLELSPSVPPPPRRRARVGTLAVMLMISAAASLGLSVLAARPVRERPSAQRVTQARPRPRATEPRAPVLPRRAASTVPDAR